MSSRASTTIGFERRFNPMLALPSAEAFVAESAGVSSPKPPNLARIVELNRGPFAPTAPAPPELPAPPEGAQLVDVRPIETHLAGHRAGAINVPVSGSSFSTRAAFVLDPAASVVVLAADADEALRAVDGLRSVAFADIAGYVLGGGDERSESVPLDELDALVASGATIVDVREKDERDEGYIPGSRHVPYRLMRACCPDLPENAPLVTICESGPRAAIGASVLRARGYDARPVVGTGMTDWLARGETSVSFRRCGS
jgi:hydroxyacylglutathione hydrolase